MEKNKCLFISTEFPPGPGGIGMHAFNVINLLHNNHNWDFTILTNQDNSEEKEILNFNKIYHSKIVRLEETPSLYKLILKCIKILFLTIKYNPKLIITSGKHATWFGALGKLVLRKKVVTFIHGSELGTKNIKEKKINKLTYSYVDLIISVSNYTLSFLKENTEIKPKSAVVVHNGANDSDFYKLTPKEIINFKKTKKVSNQKIIISLGNISERKGQWVVINSLPEILKKFPKTHYYCIGQPSKKTEFQKLAKNLNVNDNVHFLGKLKIEEIRNWLNIAEIFTMTSTHTLDGYFEGFGISVIEAALCGLPAIVTKNNNGVIESIEENITGLSIEEKNHKQLAYKIIDIFNDGKKNYRMGEKAYKRAKNYFTWNVKVDEINTLLNSLINNK